MKIVCDNCGYNWEYKGKIEEGGYCTCPSCLRKTMVTEIKKQK